MTADAIARAMLEWAAEPDGPPPGGSLTAATELARPTAATLTALQTLARSCAARLGAGNPAFGDRTPIGTDALLLAAAVAVRDDADTARSIADLVTDLRPGESGWADSVARHAVLMRCIAFLTPPLVEALLAGSPLTRVLHRPPRQRLDAGTTATDVSTATGLLGRPRGRRVLTSVLAAPSTDPAVLRWRNGLLSRLVHEHRDVVLDVYVLARTDHGEAWDRTLRAAVRDLGAAWLAADLPLAVLQYWAPLAVLDRAEPALLRSRHFLDGHRAALSAVKRFGVLAGQGR